MVHPLTSVALGTINHRCTPSGHEVNVGDTTNTDENFSSFGRRGYVRAIVMAASFFKEGTSVHPLASRQ
jgi:hypothetical protein